MCSVALGSLARIWLEFNSIQIQVGPPGRAPPCGGGMGAPPPPPPLALLARTRATSRGKAGAKRGARACGKVNFDPHCFAGNANLEIPPSQRYINVFVGSHREPSCFAARKQRSGRVSAPPSWQGRGLVGTSLWSFSFFPEGPTSFFGGPARRRDCLGPSPHRPAERRPGRRGRRGWRRPCRLFACFPEALHEGRRPGAAAGTLGRRGRRGGVVPVARARPLMRASPLMAPSWSMRD